MRQLKTVKPYPGMVIEESVIFQPGVYNFFGKEGITVRGEQIEIDGNDCVFIGGQKKRNKEEEAYSSEFSYGYGDMADDSLGYRGTGFLLEDCKNVHLHNVTAKGFEIGLHMKGCENCLITDNDFSYNSHNPDWGWDEHRDMGGMVLEKCIGNEIGRNRATDVWSALVLRESSRNYVHHNNCSHTSNVGLRMWLACHNRIEENNFSWGLRKNPDEVHARDSSCVLIESGSCHNVLRKNDMRYGGDGLFIRSLNNMMSMHNLIEENDTSYANNNAIEAWDAYNTYIRNKVNYSSYGFWLGCSDHTVLIGNEVVGNGTTFNNAPEAFGNAGISVVNGSGNGFYLEGNRIENNSGPGLAIRYKMADPIRNWVIKNNSICHNCNDERGYKGYGVYMKHCFNIHFIGNTIEDNGAEDIFRDEDVSLVQFYEPDTAYEQLKITCEKEFVTAGDVCRFSAAPGYDRYEYFVNDGNVCRECCPVIAFPKPGRYSISVNAYKDGCIAVGTADICVRPNGEKILQAENSSCWKAELAGCRIEGIKKEVRDESVALINEGSSQSRFSLECGGLDLTGKTHLTFLYQYQNDYIDWEKEAQVPTVIFTDGEGKRLTIKPVRNLLVDKCQICNQAKYSWEVLSVPLTENPDYTLEMEDGFTWKAERISLEFVYPMNSVGRFVVGDMRLENRPAAEYDDVCRMNEIPVECRKKCTSASSGTESYDDIFGSNPYCYMATRRWESGTAGEREQFKISFTASSAVSGMIIRFYRDELECVLPQSVSLYDGEHRLIRQETPVKSSYLEWKDLDLVTEELILEFTKMPGKSIAMYQCRVLKEKRQMPCLRIQEKQPLSVCASDAVVKLNIERNPKESTLSSLEYAVYDSNEKDILASRILVRGSIAADQVRSGSKVSLDLKQIELMREKTYHLLLWQTHMAAGIQNGAYYRWVGDGIAEMDTTYGYINQLEVVDKGRTGWGRNYLRINCDELVYDRSCVSEGLGNRFGLTGMDKLYQKFRIPGYADTLMHPNYFSRDGYPVDNTAVLELTCPGENMQITLVLAEGGSMTAQYGGRQAVQEGNRLILRDLPRGDNCVTLEGTGRILYIE